MFKKNPLVLIFSCGPDRTNGRNQAARDTWLRKWSSLIDYKFVYGLGVVPQLPDEIAVGAGDSYDALTEKQRAAYRWFLEEGSHDFLFVCYTDTYVHVPRLLASGYWTHLYTGRRDQEGRPFAGGGMGYWLNHSAVAMLADERPRFGYPDLDDGMTLAERKIMVWDDQRYGGDRTGDASIVVGDAITMHLSIDTGVYDPRTMYELHKRVMEGREDARVDAAM